MKRIKVSNPIIFDCWYMAAIEILNNKFIEIDICLDGLLIFDDFLTNSKFSKYIPEISEINFN